MTPPLPPPWGFQRVVVTGANGQLGAEVTRRLGEFARPLTQEICGLTDAAAVREALHRISPDLIINCAAYTAVDKAESDEKACFATNADAVETLAQLANEHAAPLVHISTDYVFGADASRTTPYTEQDQTGPVSVYGHSKLAGEQAAVLASRHVVARSCGLYTASPSGPVRGRNFCDTMLSLGREGKPLRVVNDQHCTPTYVPLLTDLLLRLISVGGQGLYHITAAGQTTWHGLAKALFEAAGLEGDLEAIPTSEYPTPAARPRYSVLDGARLEAAIGSKRPDWSSSLRPYLAASRTEAD
ncbi:dTDP-4-dehydrorhamnose reductase [Posidoniimonas polymericola]|uniref:dTDP-4-dehydrorhamnose reductase n=1 Tax=Posidoniimonas polymericola TaxID=2528002 RepID=A0A5C5ZFE8_9BACT|nr:dTDP-4-dehydrorhamnose reductase [Posidoniimonas polymericola]TWT85908.1 dTDP-4-dehydrorhamnose reductase [Posidoniimonas polymericola]